jgi:sugar/nucleoside kinase (ribokinase family)
MAGYLYQRVQGTDVQEAGEFGAAMATIKIEASGPFSGDFAKVENVLTFGAHNRYLKVFSWQEALLH